MTVNNGSGVKVPRTLIKTDWHILTWTRAIQTLARFLSAHNSAIDRPLALATATTMPPRRNHGEFMLLLTDLPIVQTKLSNGSSSCAKWRLRYTRRLRIE